METIPYTRTSVKDTVVSMLSAADSFRIAQKKETLEEIQLTIWLSECRYALVTLRENQSHTFVSLTWITVDFTGLPLHTNECREDQVTSQESAVALSNSYIDLIKAERG